MKAKLAWLLTGNLVFTLTLFTRLFVVARISGPESVGDLTLATAIVTPIMMFAQLRLRDVAATDATGRFESSSYLDLTALAAVAGVIASVGVSAMVAPTVDIAQGSATAFVGLAMLLALGRAFESFSLTSYGFGQRLERMREVAQATGARGVAGTVGFIGIYLATERLLLAALGVVVANALWAHLDAQRFRPDPGQGGHAARALRPLFLLVLPLGATSLLLALTDSVPRLIIGGQLSQEELGIFGVLGYIVVGATLVVRSLGHAVGPSFGRHVASGRQDEMLAQLWRVSLVATVLGLSMCLLIAVVGDQLVGLVFGNEFTGESAALVITALSGVVVMASAPWQTALIAQNQNKAVLVIQTVTVAIVTAASLWLVPEHGIGGAASALLIAGVVRFTLQASLVIRAARFPTSLASEVLPLG